MSLTFFDLVASIATIYDPPASTSSSGNSKDGGPDEGSE